MAHIGQSGSILLGKLDYFWRKGGGTGTVKIESSSGLRDYEQPERCRGRKKCIANFS